MLREEILEKLLFTERDRSAPPNPRNARSSRSCDHWPRPVLLERAAYLRKLARLGEGSASETIREHPGHRSILFVQLRSGMAEMHEQFTDIFIVLDGHGTLVTGGKIETTEQVGSGEIRGSAITGGSKQELRAGDLVHVAAGIPHQVLLAGDDTLSCVLVKIRESEQP